MAMTADQSADLMKSEPFRGRLQVCCVRYSDSIKTANSNAMGHVALEKWADSVYAQPVQVSIQVQPFVVMDPAVQTAGVDANGIALIDDAALQGSVEAVVNKTI